MLAFLAVAIGVVLAGCSAGSDDPSDGETAQDGEEWISVVATTTIWADVATQVAGADADVMS